MEATVSVLSIIFTLHYSSSFSRTCVARVALRGKERYIVRSGKAPPPKDTVLTMEETTHVLSMTY
jgi:hypothetical protein